MTQKHPDPATEYAQGVASGEIIAGPYVRDACARHLRDLEEGAARGLRWDSDDAERIYRYFRTVLRLNGGVHEGKPFELHASQKFIVGSLFGWKRADDSRRFRMAFVETGKGSGKSPLAAGIGHYMTGADREAGAQTFAAATDKDQAGVLFKDAVSMAKQSPALSNRVTFTGGEGRETNIAYLANGSFFRPISSESSGKGKSGYRVHCALLDEIHEHPTNAMVEFLRAGTKGRAQALIFMITNSGVDRTSVCFEYHNYATKVSAGEIQDDSFFGYVCSVDENGYTETFSLNEGIKRILETCSCNVKITQPARLSLQTSVPLATTSTAAERNGSVGSGVRTIPIGQFLREACVIAATKNGISQPIPTHIEDIESASGSGARKTLGGTSNPDGEGYGRKHLANSASPQDSTKNSSPRKAESAQSANESLDISASITTMLQGLHVDSSVATAMRESACSEIVSRMYDAHAPTCKVRQYTISEGKLSLRHPAEDPFTDPVDETLGFPRSWLKANPLLGVTFQPSYLEEQVRQAKGMPSKESIVRRLNFCQWVDAASPWIDGDLWRACEVPEADFPSDLALKERDCFLGLDLSSKRDLTAKARVWPDGEGGYDAVVEFWTPEDTLEQRGLADRVPYRAWATSGDLNAVPGKSLDYAYVAKSVAEDTSKFNIIALAFDQWRIEDFQRELDDAGIESFVWDGPDKMGDEGIRLVRHAQGFGGGASATSLWMPRSIGTLEELVLNGKLRVRYNPVLRWNSASAVLEQDATGNKKWEKRKSSGKIDGIVALSMAIGAAVGVPPKPEWSMVSSSL